MDDKLVVSSMKWASLAEIFSKLIGPITTMFLARLLTPDDFGVVAIIVMCLSFIDIFKDSGFSKYVIYCEFQDDHDKDVVLNVAFWANFAVSLVLYCLIYIFARKISVVLLSNENPLLLRVSGLTMFATSFSAIQNSILKRDFQFKKYFFIRIVYTLVPLIVTVPLAFVFRNYWSLAIGNLVNAVISSLLLTYWSDWKPRLTFSFHVLQKIFSFCAWFLFEGLLYWMLYWVDTVVVTRYFSKYYLGLFKNTSNIVISIMSIVGATVTTVLFTSLTKKKNDKNGFINLYSFMVKITSYFIFPMAMGMFLFREECVRLLFGNAWTEAGIIFGLFAVMYGLNVAFVLISAETLKALGKPKILLFSEILQLTIIVVFSLIGVQGGFYNFLYVRVAAIVGQILIVMLVMYFVFKELILTTFVAMEKPFVATWLMVVLALVLRFLNQQFVVQFMYFPILFVFYFAFIWYFFNDDFKVIRSFISTRKGLSK